MHFIWPLCHLSNTDSLIRPDISTTYGTSLLQTYRESILAVTYCSSILHQKVVSEWVVNFCNQQKEKRFYKQNITMCLDWYWYFLTCCKERGKCNMLNYILQRKTLPGYQNSNESGQWIMEWEVTHLERKTTLECFHVTIHKSSLLWLMTKI